MKGSNTMKLATITQRLNSAAYAQLTAPPTTKQVRNARHVFRALSVRHGGGETPYLVTPAESSAKLAGHDSDLYEQGVTYLAPHRNGGVNLCPYSTKGCRAGCLGTTSGRMRFAPQQRAQYVRTRFMVEHPDEFVTVLADEIRRESWRVRLAGKRYAYRFNGTSDVAIETAPAFLDILRLAGVSVFVDYTKRPDRRGWIESDYYVAASVSERTASDDIGPGSVVVVDIKRGHPIPETYNGHPTTDGDLDVGDMRFLDPADAVVLLRAKGALVGVKGTPAGMVKPATGY